MEFKNDKVREGYKNPDPMLVEVLAFIEWYCLSHFNSKVIITETSRTHKRTIDLYMGSVNPKTQELYKPNEVPYSTHSTDPLRAVDKRGEHHHEDNQKLDRAVNEMYAYDPGRPNMKVCRFHKVGDGAYHVHIQVHDNTCLRKSLGV